MIETIGRRTGELHRAFATADAADPDFAPEPVTDADLERMVRQGASRAPSRPSPIWSICPTSPTTRPAISPPSCSACATSCSSASTRWFPTIARGNKLRLHNDYHLPKILVAENDVYIVDFEGEPDRRVEERRQKAPPSRDIATMLRSFDYAVRTAVDRQKQRGASQLEEIETLRPGTGARKPNGDS